MKGRLKYLFLVLIALIPVTALTLRAQIAMAGTDTSDSATESGGGVGRDDPGKF